MSLRAGTCRAAGDFLPQPETAPSRPGTFLCDQGRFTRRGTRILSPYAQDVPARSGPHPAAHNVPGHGRHLCATPVDGTALESRTNA